MKRILVAGLLALVGLSLGQATASADCFHVYRPCFNLPVPPIPIYCPKFKFFCESCNAHCCPCPGGPWWAQFPGNGPPMGYAVGQFGAFNTGGYGYGASIYGGGFGYAGTAYSGGYGYAGYYGQAAAPAANYAPPTQGWNGGYYTNQLPTPGGNP